MDLPFEALTGYSKHPGCSVVVLSGSLVLCVFPSHCACGFKIGCHVFGTNLVRWHHARLYCPIVSFILLEIIDGHSAVGKMCSRLIVLDRYDTLYTLVRLRKTGSSCMPAVPAPDQPVESRLVPLCWHHIVCHGLGTSPLPRPRVYTKKNIHCHIRPPLPQIASCCFADCLSCLSGPQAPLYPCGRNMASSAHQPFVSRSVYTSGKLPDRSLNPNPIPFGATTLSRHRALGGANPGPGDFGVDGGKSTQPLPPPPVHSQNHAPSQDATNPLNRLTEEQREEINEAVSTLLFLPFSQSKNGPFLPHSAQFYISNLFLCLLGTSSLSSTLIATAISTTMSFASPYVPSASMSPSKN
jgi:hypothetical protein